MLSGLVQKECLSGQIMKTRYCKEADEELVEHREESWDSTSSKKEKWTYLFRGMVKMNTGGARKRERETKKLTYSRKIYHASRWPSGRPESANNQPCNQIAARPNDRKQNPERTIAEKSDVDVGNGEGLMDVNE